MSEGGQCFDYLAACEDYFILFDLVDCLKVVSAWVAACEDYFILFDLVDCLKVVSAWVAACEDYFILFDLVDCLKVVSAWVAACEDYFILFDLVDCLKVVSAWVLILFDLVCEDHYKFILWLSWLSEGGQCFSCLWGLLYSLLSFDKISVL